MARINREVPGVTLTVLDDQSIFIDRSIGSVREHALLGSLLVVLVIFAFLRDWRATIIICTSIPISVIGTFALLYFGGYTLNTLTFGGLALGIGMIVDAAIVVLENTHRHLEMGKDRMTAAIDGAEEVWSAILASTLTHIAVFVPMLFLTGVSSIMFGQLAAVVSFSLAMSLFVAVTIVPVLCSRLLSLPVAGGRAARPHRRAVPGQRAGPRRHRPRLRPPAAPVAAPPADRVRGRHRGLRRRAGAAAAGRLRVPAHHRRGRGHRRRRAGRRHPARSHRGGADPPSRRRSARPRRRRSMLLTQAGGGGGGGGGFGNQQTNRGSITVRLVPKDERQRTSEQIAMDLRRRLSGLPGVVIRARASGGQQMRMPGGGGGDGSRLSVEVRGHDLDESARLARDLKSILDTTPGIADSRLGRDEGRPELAVRVDRDKAAMLGMTVTGVAETIRTNVAGTQAAFFREAGNEYPIVVRLREEDREEVAVGRRRAAQHPRRPGAAGQERHGRRPRHRADADRPQEPGAHPARQRRDRGDAQRGRGRTCRRGFPS